MTNLRNEFSAQGLPLIFGHQVYATIKWRLMLLINF